MSGLMCIPLVTIAVAVLSVNTSCKAQIAPAVPNPEVIGYQGPVLDPNLSAAESKKFVAQWEKDREGFEHAEKAEDGLGPVYNAIILGPRSASMSPSDHYSSLALPR